MMSFDDAYARFTNACVAAAQWKHLYNGAAYSTRLRKAVADLQQEISSLQAVLDEDEAAVRGR